MPKFSDRARYLEEQVGDGNLVMGGVVGQPYAAAEHERLYYRHPRGGMPKYLEVPFEMQRDEMIEKLALNAVTPEGSRLQDAAVEVAGEFDNMVRRNAPVEFDVLRDSTEYYVEDDGILVFVSGQRDPRNLDKE